MDVWGAPVLDTRGEYTDERQHLLRLLAGLPPSGWATGTAAGHWTVKDVVLHLVDGDLTRLAAGRDGELSGVLPATPDGARFARSLAAKNERWLTATRHLSPRVILDLLASSGAQLDAWTATADLRAPARVSWASDDPVPAWLDLAREFTETWVHHQQIRHAVGLYTDTARLPYVLRTFGWALPHQVRVPARAGTSVTVDLDVGGVWRIASRSDGHWALVDAAAGQADAAVRFTAEAAWRSFVGQPIPDDSVVLDGPVELTSAVLDVRGIIA